MNCHEVKDHISSAVDNRLVGNLKTEFDAHIALCQGCRNEFELERLTKRVVQQTLRRSPAPATLSAEILSHIASPPVKESSWWYRLWSTPRVKPAFAAGLVALIAILLFVSLPLTIRHTHAAPIDNNIIHQTFNNYDAILTGSLVPDVTTGDYSEVKSYFQSRVDYAVRVPKIDKCKEMGALVSSFDGKRLAHLMYRFDDKVVYLYQVDMKSALDGTTLTLPPQAKEELLKTGWYIESPHEHCTLVMWVVDNTLCTAMADIDKTQLIAYLSYPE